VTVHFQPSESSQLTIGGLQSPFPANLILQDNPFSLTKKSTSSEPGWDEPDKPSVHTFAGSCEQDLAAFDWLALIRMVQLEKSVWQSF
jgi:hypothetical protein